MTASLHVFCYDHNLKLLWKNSALQGDMQPGEHVREVALLITPHKVTPVPACACIKLVEPHCVLSVTVRH